MIPKFIRVKGDIFNVHDIVRVTFDLGDDTTCITSKNGQTCWAKYNGDLCDDIWELMKLALKPVPESTTTSYPSPQDLGVPMPMVPDMRG